MERQQQELQQAIMRRVVRAHFLRRLLHPTLCKAYLLCMLIIVSLFLMSVPSIVANMAPYSLMGVAQYIGSAFMHTEIIVQGVLLGTAALVVWMVRDAIKGLASVSFSKRAGI